MGVYPVSWFTARMRILHIYKDYFPVCGGIENYIRVLAEAHAAVGHRVTVLCCAVRGSGESRKTIGGVEVWRVPRLFTFRSMPISPAMFKAVSRAEVDVVHVHSPFPLGEQAALRLAGRVPVVVTHHADVVRQRLLMLGYAPLYRRFLRRVTRIIATSPPYRESSKWLQRHREKCVVIPLGVDIQRFTPPERPYAGRPTILFVGRLRYYKGLDTLIRALKTLHEVQLKVVGTGPMEPRWRALAAKLGVAERVTFMGDVPDEALPDCYREADLFVLPANCRAEAFGTVLLEAMASGLSCVSTAVGSGTSWVVAEGETGIVVPSQSPDAMSESIRKLLTNSRLRADMAQAGRDRVVTGFSLKTVCERILALYHTLS